MMSTKDEATRSLLAVVGTNKCAHKIRRRTKESKERAIKVNWSLFFSELNLFF